MCYLVKMKSAKALSTQGFGWFVSKNSLNFFIYYIYYNIKTLFILYILYIYYTYIAQTAQATASLKTEKKHQRIDWSALHRLLCAALNAIWRGLGYCWVVFKSIDKYLHPEMPLECGNVCRPQSWLSHLQYKVDLWSILSIRFSQRYRAWYVNKLHLSQVGLQKHS